MAATSSSSADTNNSSSTVTSATATSSNASSGVEPTGSTQPARISNGVIALLAVIGAVIGGIFIGFFIYSRVKQYRNRGKRHPSRPKASLSLSQSAAGASSTQSATMVESLRESGDDRGLRRPAPPSNYSATSTPTRARAGSAREGPDDRIDHVRRPRQSYNLTPREPETRWVPPSRPQPRPSQPREPEIPIEDDEPRFRFMAHPYQNTGSRDSSASLPPDPEKQADALPLAFALAVSSHAGGSESPLPPTPPRGHSAENQSASGNSEEIAAGPSRQGPPRVESMPSNPSNSPPLERKLSKSFLTFDDVETPSSSTPHLPLFHQSPVNLYQSPALPSSSGHTPNPNPGANKVGTVTSRFMTVVASYKPLLSDELPLKIGDVARLLHEFDDGWCIVERNGVTGAVPKVCLQERPPT